MSSLLVVKAMKENTEQEAHKHIITSLEHSET
jgi:hypothetical protein